MPLHDEYARQTPFEIAFPDFGDAETLFQQVVEEADARGVPMGDLSRFIMLGSVAALVKSLRGPDAPMEVAHESAALAFHALHFARAGRRLDLVTTAVARHLVAESSAWAEFTAPGPGAPAPAGQAGYVQLPQHLFWMEVSPDDPPQSVDGFFWTLTEDDVLRVLLALGLSGDQGMVIVPLPEAPWADRGAWLNQSMRDESADFASSLPGAELDSLYSFESAGEVLKLLVRLFAHVERVQPTSGTAGATGGSPTPSTLPFFRVVANA